jgi:hypothetical protein
MNFRPKFQVSTSHDPAELPKPIALSCVSKGYALSSAYFSLAALLEYSSIQYCTVELFVCLLVGQEQDWICSNIQSRRLSYRQSQSGSWGT